MFNTCFTPFVQTECWNLLELKKKNWNNNTHDDKNKWINFNCVAHVVILFFFDGSTWIPWANKWQFFMRKKPQVIFNFSGWCFIFFRVLPSHSNGSFETTGYIASAAVTLIQNKVKWIMKKNKEYGINGQPTSKYIAAAGNNSLNIDWQMKITNKWEQGKVSSNIKCVNVWWQQ